MDWFTKKEEAAAMPGRAGADSAAPQLFTVTLIEFAGKEWRILFPVKTRPLAA